MPISFLLRESVPEHWLHWQQGARAVNVACLVWLLATLVLSSGYSGTLLSSLMMNYYERPGCSSGEYDCMSRFYMLHAKSFDGVFCNFPIEVPAMAACEKPIDTIQDIIDNKIKLLVATKTMLHGALLTDPRSSVQRVMGTLAETKPKEPWEGDEDWKRL